MTRRNLGSNSVGKIDMLDFADLVALNKFDKRALWRCDSRCKKQYQRNHNLWDVDTDKMPIFRTVHHIQRSWDEYTLQIYHG